ncbi:type II secretion system protein E [Olsenella sp. oral taxon 807]|uniref:CpaF family protein n=1 Tax=Olsenella sp. oral taxon 807 TaxID=712411 RepID=UPI00067A1B14|nr:type II secretion system protein E [Olsenella sp. oral taxon 807]
MSLLELVREQESQVEGGTMVALRRPSEEDVTERLKGDLVERLGLGVVAQFAAGSDISRARRELSVTCRAILNTAAYADVALDDRERLVRRTLDDICGLGPLQELLEDEEVSEVVVNGTRGLFFEKHGRLQAAQAVFESDEQILMIIDRILAPLGRRLDRASPIVNARLANGDRVNAVAAPVSVDGPAVTIRKFSNRISSLERLVSLGSLPEWYARLLSLAVRMREDIAVAGGTGSGKTTLLNALSCEIGLEERIVTIEDSAELRFDRHPDVVRLEARDSSIEGTGEVTIRDLVKNALRMRPDRIIVGECRSEETIDMLQAMNTGHDGSLTTLHAGTPKEAILRLVLMARFGMDLPTEVIEAQIATALDLLVMSHRMSDGLRFIGSLSEVSLGEDDGVRLVECVRFDELERNWKLVREPRFVDAALRAGMVGEQEVRSWRSRFP